MPHSLRAKLGNLRYKKIISDKDYDRLCKALDNEGVLDEIRAEIEQEYKAETEHSYGQGLRRALNIIDKYKAESEGSKE